MTATVLEFYSFNEIKKPTKARVFHNNPACPAGREIPPNERRNGRGGFRLCDDCAALNKQGR